MVRLSAAKMKDIFWDDEKFCKVFNTAYAGFTLYCYKRMFDNSYTVKRFFDNRKTRLAKKAERKMAAKKAERKMADIVDDRMHEEVLKKMEEEMAYVRAKIVVLEEENKMLKERAWWKLW